MTCVPLFAAVALVVGGASEAVTVVSEQDILRNGSGGSRVTAEFRFRNETDQTLEPTVRWTDCGCNEFRFEPTHVGPGEDFRLSVGGNIPIWVREHSRVYQVGFIGTSSDLDQRVRLRLRRSEEHWLAVAPQVATGKWLEDDRLELVLDVAYDLRSDAVGDPARDLLIDTDLGPVKVLVLREEVLSKAIGTFSGLVRVLIMPHAQPVSGRVTISIAGAPEQVVQVRAAARSAD